MKVWDRYKKHVVSVGIRNMDINETVTMGEIIEPIDVSGLIVLRRAEIGMSREDLAYRTGLSEKTITNIEKMDMSPSIETLMRLLNGLGLKLKICVK